MTLSGHRLSSASPILQAPKAVLRPRISNAVALLFLMDLVFLTLINLFTLYHIHSRLDIFDHDQAFLVAMVCVATTLMLLYAAGSYRRDAMVRFGTAMIPLGIALGFSVVVLTPIIHFVLGRIFSDELVYRSVSRSATLALLSSGISLVVGVANRMAFFTMSRHHWFERRILVIGTGPRAKFLHDIFLEDKYRNYASLIFVPEQALGGHEVIAEVPVHAEASEGRCSLEDLTAALRVDCVVVAAKNNTVPLEPILSCKAAGIPILEFNTFIERETGRVNLQWVDISWLVYSHGFEIRVMDLFLKRFMDIAGALIMLLAALPVLAFAMIAIKLEGRGSIFFCQTRVTQGGRPFELFKLRTMRMDAEKNGAQWAAKDDPRITPVGSLLRRFRIDEIPQLINVLRGDMSLVGPRPERPVFVQRLASEIEMYNLRHSVKAGITGWAQINYPYGASLEDARCKLEYDLFYMKHFNVLHDLAIILQTCRTVLSPHGVR